MWKNKTEKKQAATQNYVGEKNASLKKCDDALKFTVEERERQNEMLGEKEKVI